MPDLFQPISGHDVAFRDHSDRGLVSATGSDRVRFTNGMISNDVAILEPGQSCYATLLTRKGRIVADLYVLVLEDSLLIDVAPGCVESVIEALDKHLIADDVELRDLSADWGEIAFEGPAARELLQDRGHPTPEPSSLITDPAGRVWLGGGFFGPAGVRVLGPADRLAKLVTDVPELSAELHEVLRVESALPRYGVDMTERHFPIEVGLEHALSRTKGCYIGQEIVERILARGAVNKRLVKLETDAPVLPEASIRLGTTVVGRVTSAVMSPLSGPLALGYVRTEQAEPGQLLDIEGIAARVVAKPVDAVVAP